MSVPVGWSPSAKSFAVTLVELATGHMERVARLQEEDGVKLTFQVIIQGEAAEDTARKVMGLLYPANNNDEVKPTKHEPTNPEREESDGEMRLTNNEVRVLLAAGGANIRRVEAETATTVRFGGLWNASQKTGTSIQFGGKRGDKERWAYLYLWK